MSDLLISEPPLQVVPSLAVELKSVDKAIILQQIHYWLQKSNNIVDGHRWVYNTVSDWQKQFPWLTTKTVQRYLKDLCDRGLLITGNYNKANFDRTKWYRIDYSVLDKLANSKGTVSPNGKELSVPMERDCQSQPIPIDYTENTHKINNNKSKSDNLDNSIDYQKEFNSLWELYPPYRKQGKKIAFSSYKAWRKADKDNTFAKAKTQLDAYLNYIKIHNVDRPFVKAGKTWFANIDDAYDQLPAKTINSPKQKRVEKETHWDAVAEKMKGYTSKAELDKLSESFKKYDEPMWDAKSEENE